MKNEMLFDNESNEQMLQHQLVTRADMLKFQSALLNTIQNLVHTKPTDTKKWLRSTEVKELLGVSAGTLQNLRINGTLPFSKVGGIIFYNSDDIQKILKENMQ